MPKTEEAKAARMGRRGAKPAPIPQAPWVLTFVPGTAVGKTGGYKFKKGALPA